MRSTLIIGDTEKKWNIGIIKIANTFLHDSIHIHHVNRRTIVPIHTNRKVKVLNNRNGINPFYRTNKVHFRILSVNVPLMFKDRMDAVLLKETVF